MRYRYLDITTENLTPSRVHLFCACGRHVTFGPEDWTRWPGSSLHRIAARLRCTVCGAIGDIPEVRIASAAAGGTNGVSYAHGDSTDVSAGGPIQTTHPRRRSRRTGYCDGRKLLKAPKPLRGEAYKDALMPRALEIASTGRYQRWLDVVLCFESWEQDALRAWLAEAEKDELEMIARSGRRYQINKLPACCAAGAMGMH